MRLTKSKKSRKNATFLRVINYCRTSAFCSGGPMGKKRIILLVSLIIIAIISASFILSGKQDSKTSSKLSDSPKVNSTTEAAAAVDDAATETDKAPVTKTEETITNSEDIQVNNNSLEYDIKASLYEKSTGETFLRLEYYNGGNSVVKELGTDKIPEIKGVFQSGAKIQGKPGQRVKAVYLNSRYSKAYILVEGKTRKDDVETFLYSFNLKDFVLKKLYSDYGSYSELLFNKDFKYLAFSYTSEIMSRTSYLQMIKCENDEVLVDKNKRGSAVLLGNRKSDGTKFTYSIISWQTGNIAKLKETASGGTSAGAEKQTEVFYDIEKNMFVNSDGSPVNEKAAQSKAESGPVKALKSFYELMSASGMSTSEQFEKAYNLLEDGFTIKLTMLKQFGIDELGKKDMDLSNFTLYSSLFKAAKIENIVEEKTVGNLSTIYYFQSLSLGEGEPVRQPLAAVMKKTDKGWRALSLSEGNINEKPFKKYR